MGMTASASALDALKRAMARSSRIVDNSVLAALTRLGEQCVARVRDRSQEASWFDHTGNLRSSIGYLVLHRGREVGRGGFLPTGAPEGDGADGQRQGSDYARQVAAVSSGDYQLVLVAGMAYASLVEAREGKDVLASAELWARQQWQRRLPRLEESIRKRLQRL